MNFEMDISLPQYDAYFHCIFYDLSDRDHNHISAAYRETETCCQMEFIFTFKSNSNSYVLRQADDALHSVESELRALVSVLWHCISAVSHCCGTQLHVVSHHITYTSCPVSRNETI